MGKVRPKKVWDPIGQVWIQPPGPGRPKGSRRVDLAGSIFRHLTVRERVEDAPGAKAQYRCECDCGTEVVVRGDNLKAGRTVSCGHVGYADPYSVVGRPDPLPTPENWRERAAAAQRAHVESERRRNGF